MPSVETYSEYGGRIAAAAIDWALRRQLPSPEHHCELPVSGYPAAAFALQHRTSRLRCNTDFGQLDEVGDDVADSPPDTIWLVTPLAGAAPAGLAEHPGPVMVMTSSPDVLRELGLIGEGIPVEVSDVGWLIDRQAANLGAALSDEVAVADEGTILRGFPRGNLSAGAFPLATLSGDAEAVAYWVVEEGAPLVDGTLAPGPRAVMLIGPDLGRISMDGLKLFDASMQWLMAHNL
jgi:hypothetical protein